MAKTPAKSIDFTFNSVALEDELSSIEQEVTQETPVVTSFADAGPRRVVGNYDYRYALEGFFDPAASQGDATLAAQIGGSGAATDFEPTGNAAGAGDPNYTSTSMLLSSYSIRGQVGGPITYSAELVGNAAISRDVV